MKKIMTDPVAFFVMHFYKELKNENWKYNKKKINIFTFSYIDAVNLNIRILV